jgi:hypothetical protein
MSCPLALRMSSAISSGICKPISIATTCIVRVFPRRQEVFSLQQTLGVPSMRYSRRSWGKHRVRTRGRISSAMPCSIRTTLAEVMPAR